MTMPLYASAEQVMRDRSELARKGIARGRSVVVLTYADGVLFVAENPSTTLHKVSEIYDRIGFAAVGRYSEFEALRTLGIRYADVRGYAYDRRDVTARALANTYASQLGTIFTEQLKPFEVEICVAEVGESAEADQLYRLTYDGSISDEPNYMVMGGQAEAISTVMKEAYREGMELAEAVPIAVKALTATAAAPARAGSAAAADKARVLGVKQLEVAVLERARPRRKFRRITGAALQALLPAEEPADKPADKPEGDTPAEGTEDAK
ncbi:proteasome alpha subunit [Crossiella equi]|uniref:Proteasome subunit alpha n=1 Tax=Crossiella equi TaxID=130796 RepID=A0ABS5AAG8_9PSEU|nr:proteasome subunit alpha [Crossiella equi]MBP2472720.1 proteasome alpha subunit [Crossiella equi]